MPQQIKNSFCGIGLDYNMLGKGVDGPALSHDDIEAMKKQYDDTVGGWCSLVYNANNNSNNNNVNNTAGVTRSMLEEQYAKQFPGRELYCNKDIQNYKDYFNYARRGVEQIESKGYSPAFIEFLDGSDIPWKVGKSNYTYCTYLYGGTDTSVCPGVGHMAYVGGFHQSQCPVRVRRFDSAFIPSNRHVDAVLQPGEPEGNEVLLTSWGGGLQYKALAPYMAVYYNTNSNPHLLSLASPLSPRDQAFRIANMFYKATGIHIPVVHMSSVASARDLADEKALQIHFLLNVHRYICYIIHILHIVHIRYIRMYYILAHINNVDTYTCSIHTCTHL